jgi:hypothetical protein
MQPGCPEHFHYVRCDICDSIGHVAMFGGCAGKNDWTKHGRRKKLNAMETQCQTLACGFGKADEFEEPIASGYDLDVFANLGIIEKRHQRFDSLSVSQHRLRSSPAQRLSGHPDVAETRSKSRFLRHPVSGKQGVSSSFLLLLRPFTVP